jgi:Domain of unknown function (DUF4160)
MATITAFAVSGLTIWFWSNDHEPPHFHAKRRGEWEVKVFFLLDAPDMIEVVWRKKRPSKRCLKQLASLAEQHRVALIEQWEQVHQGDG